MTISLLNLVTQLRNGSIAKRDCIKIVYSKSNQRVLSMLQAGGFISGYSIINRMLVVKLRYTNRVPAFNLLLLLSTPGRRKYISFKELIKLSIPGSTLFVGSSDGLTSITILKDYSPFKGGEPLFLIR